MEISVIGNISDEEAQVYIRKAHEKFAQTPDRMIITEAGEFVNIEYVFRRTPFERIRRITGYLSTVSTWNNAKRAELSDRTRHEYL